MVFWCWCWFLWEIGRGWSRFIEAHGGRDKAAIGERCPDGRQEVGSEPRLNDIAEPARIECGLGVVCVFVDREEDEHGQAAASAGIGARLRCRRGDGMVMSSTMTSGWSRSASARSSRPSPTKPTTQHSPASAAAVSASIAGWSSARSTRGRSAEPASEMEEAAVTAPFIGRF